MRFSERVGAKTMPRSIQIESMDDALRNSLWNAVLSRFSASERDWTKLADLLARYLFKIPMDTVPTSEERARAWTREWFFGAVWHEVYDIVEFLVDNVDVIKRPDDANVARYYRDQRVEFLREIDAILETELSGYRFVKGQLAPISDPSEIGAIEAAAGQVDNESLTGAAVHIRAALSLLGQKPHPDYRNSIKESISAVEAAVNTAAGTNGGGVAKAIETLASKVEIHPALRAALKQLYGYTSDEDGIRHAILEQASVGFAEAKFMLVACAAFVNFISDKQRQASM